MRAITSPLRTTEPSSTPRYWSRPMTSPETEALVRATTYPLAVMPAEVAVPPPVADASATRTSVPRGERIAHAVAPRATTAIAIHGQKRRGGRGAESSRWMRRRERSGWDMAWGAPKGAHATNPGARRSSRPPSPARPITMTHDRQRPRRDGRARLPLYFFFIELRLRGTLPPARR